jgi:hypothetical protein
VIHKQPWPPAWKKIAVHLCTLAGKDLQRPIFESQPHLARDLNMGEGSYPLAERALGRDGFHSREKIDPGGQYTNGHPAPIGGRVLRLRQEWFDLHANDPIPPKRGRKTGKASGKPRSTMDRTGSTSGPTCPPNCVQAPARRDELLDEEKAERATLVQDLRTWAVTDDELKERLGGVDLATAPLPLLQDMLDEATDLLGSPEAKVANDPHGSPEPHFVTDPSRSPIQADQQDTHEEKTLRGKEEDPRRGESLPSPATEEEFEERAAIMQFDGGLPRAEAERRARALLMERGSRVLADTTNCGDGLDERRVMP